MIHVGFIPLAVKQSYWSKMRGQIAIQLAYPRHEELRQIHLIGRIISEMVVTFKNKDSHLGHFQSQNCHTGQYSSSAPAHHRHYHVHKLTRLSRNDQVVGFDATRFITSPRSTVA